jgi:hypothetical protein
VNERSDANVNDESVDIRQVMRDLRERRELEAWGATTDQLKVSKIESLEVDESAIAIVVTVPGRLSPEGRLNARDQLRECLPGLKVPWIILDAGARMEVLKASDAKTLDELLHGEATTAN